MSKSNAVVIKSFPNGIALHLDPVLPFDQLLEEIELKFRESDSFFKDAKMALSFEDRILTDKEEHQILDTIKNNCQLHIICIVGNENDETNTNYLKALQQLNPNGGTGNNEGQFYKGTLKNGQVLETESNIVILGDVYPGSEVIAAKDIIVLGGLYGAAYAGAGGQEGHYIVALDMSPEQLQIGDFKYHTKEKQSRWSIVKPKVQPKIAYLKEDKVVTEPLTKELLNQI